MPKAHPSTLTGQIMMLSQARSAAPSIPAIRATSPLSGISPTMAMPRTAPAPTSLNLWDQMPEELRSYAQEVIRHCCGKTYSTEDTEWCRDKLGYASRLFESLSTMRECIPEPLVAPGSGGGGGVLPPKSSLPCYTALQLSAFAMAAKYFAACRDRVFPPRPKFGTMAPIDPHVSQEVDARRRVAREEDDFRNGFAVGQAMCLHAKTKSPVKKLDWMTSTSASWQNGWAHGVNTGCVQRCEMPAGWPCFISAT